MLKSVDAGVLNIAYQESGDPNGWPVVLLHGFPYDPHIFHGVAPILTAAGARVIAPWLRGYGGTRFLSHETPRSGEQAALGADLLALLDAVQIPAAILAGHDWGGRAACIVAALWPDRAAGLVSQNGYNMQDIAGAASPQPPETEFRLWYQYYFHSERGRRALTEDRAGFCRFLWRLWSPEWHFDDATYDRTAESFDTPDFVDVVIHSYRHRFGLVAGDPAYADIERRVAEKPAITVPGITVDGESDGVLAPGGTAFHAKYFTGGHEHRVVPKGGHNLPQESPELFARAILDVRNIRSHKDRLV
jgi:pimeloyl-ACP methyl ester carboxylesterase